VESASFLHELQDVDDLAKYSVDFYKWNCLFLVNEILKARVYFGHHIGKLKLVKGVGQQLHHVLMRRKTLPTW
jgi:hypothetical protein